MSEGKAPEKKPSGIHSCSTVLVAGLTALGGIIAATATLVTALYGAGVLRGRPAAAPTPAASATPVAVASTRASPLLGGSTPTPSPTATSQSGAALLLADDFSNPASGWEVYVAADGETDYRNGEYRISVYEPELVIWGSPKPAVSLADFVLEVDARSEGPLDNDYGVIVRSQTGGSGFYMFVVSSDGQYSVQILQNHNWRKLAIWTPSDVIRQGNETNHLRVVCQGQQMRFFVNGKLLVEVQDATYRSGNIGLLAGTFDETGVVVHFDNLTVKALSGT